MRESNERSVTSGCSIHVRLSRKAPPERQSGPAEPRLSGSDESPAYAGLKPLR